MYVYTYLSLPPPPSSLAPPLSVRAIYSVHRAVEDGGFTHTIDNKQLLFHSSAVQNFVGILSRYVRGCGLGS